MSLRLLYNIKHYQALNLYLIFMLKNENLEYCISNHMYLLDIHLSEVSNQRFILFTSDVYIFI